MTAEMRSLVITVLVIIICAAVVIGIMRRIAALRTGLKSWLGSIENMKFLFSEAKRAAETHAAEEKSLCGMTELMKPLIKRDFPEFDWDEYRVDVDRHVADHIVKDMNGKDPVIHRTEISDYRKKDGSCTIDAQTSAGYTLEGKKIEKRFTTQISYVQDYLHLPAGQTGEGLTCPNCGAAIKVLGRKYCEYCGSAVTEVNRRVWKIFDTREF